MRDSRMNMGWGSLKGQHNGGEGRIITGRRELFRGREGKKEKEREDVKEEFKGGWHARSQPRFFILRGSRGSLFIFSLYS